MLEGVRLVAEAVRAGAALPLVLYAPEQLVQTAAGQQLLDALEGQPGCYAAMPQVVGAAAETVSPQGVVAVARWMEQVESGAMTGLTLVLDAVQDPGNVGTLLRSAEAAGVGQVLCAPGTADVYSPKVVRAAMGAHFYLPLHAEMSWDDIATALREMRHVYAAVGHAMLMYDRADWQGAAALMIGNEAQGVGAPGLALASEQIAIPMVGRAESLNAGVAGSVILFEALRQRRNREQL